MSGPPVTPPIMEPNINVQMHQAPAQMNPAHQQMFQAQPVDFTNAPANCPPAQYEPQQLYVCCDICKKHDAHCPTCNKQVRTVRKCKTNKYQWISFFGLFILCACPFALVCCQCYEYDYKCPDCEQVLVHWHPENGN